MNQITIGNGPDFVMRMGATTYSHHFSVTFTPMGGTTINESMAHPSLQALLKELKQKLVPKGWSQTLPVKWVSGEKLDATCETEVGTIVIQYHLINGLKEHQKNRLVNQILRGFT